MVEKMVSRAVLSDHFCECGCGRQTVIAWYDHSGSGQVKGQPNRFVKGHSPSAPAALHPIGQIANVSYTQRSRQRQPAPPRSLKVRHFNTRDLTGKRFGLLVVLGDSGERNARRAILWTCRCDCGQMALRDGSTLKMARSISCGHVRADAARNRIPGPRRSGVAARMAFRAYRDAARPRGYAFELSEQEFVRLCLAPCEYCGSPPSMEKRSRYEKCVMNGLDRVDNAKGYTRNNVVPCCKICNRMKHSLPVGAFLEHVARIQSHQTFKEVQSA